MKPLATQPRRHRLVFAFAVWLLVSALLIAGCQSLVRRALFYPTHDDRRPSGGLAEWTHDGRIIGVAREVTQPRMVWLLLHGNGGQAADRLYALPAFEADDAVFILEYPGYGLREGRPSRRAFDTAAREAYASLRARFPGIRVGVVGESIGSGPASVLSRETPAPDKIVLIVPFDSIRAVARDHVRYLPTGWLLLGSWDNVDALSGYRGPVDIFGAEQDEVIPIAHAENLARSLPQATFHRIPGGHGWPSARAVQVRRP